MVESFFHGVEIPLTKRGSAKHVIGGIKDVNMTRVFIEKDLLVLQENQPLFDNPIFVAKNMVGHKNVQSTEIYIRSLLSSSELEEITKHILDSRRKIEN